MQLQFNSAFAIVVCMASTVMAATLISASRPEHSPMRMLATEPEMSHMPMYSHGPVMRYATEPEISPTQMPAREPEMSHMSMYAAEPERSHMQIYAPEPEMSITPMSTPEPEMWRLPMYASESEISHMIMSTPESELPPEPELPIMPATTPVMPATTTSPLAVASTIFPVSSSHLPEATPMAEERLLTHSVSPVMISGNLEGHFPGSFVSGLYRSNQLPGTADISRRLASPLRLYIGRSVWAPERVLDPRLFSPDTGMTTENWLAQWRRMRRERLRLRLRRSMRFPHSRSNRMQPMMELEE